MLTIREYVNGTMMHACGYSEKHFLCPHCMEPQMHVTEDLSFCTECYEEILDIELMLEKSEYRIGYHFGYVKNEG